MRPCLPLTSVLVLLLTSLVILSFLPPMAGAESLPGQRLVRIQERHKESIDREAMLGSRANSQDPTDTFPPSMAPSPPRSDDDEQEQEIPVTDKFWPSFVTALLMILVSELGDKTFLITAILAMRHSRLLVGGASLLALALMTVISAACGLLLPSLVPRRYTAWLAALLFLVFGAKGIVEGAQMSSTRMREEYDEVNHEIEDSEDVTRRMESGGRADEHGGESERLEEAPPVDSSFVHVHDHHQQHLSLRSSRTNLSDGLSTGSASAYRCHDLFYRYLARLLRLLHALRVGKIISPVFLQTFSLTFLAEWGDRSQLATIALAAAQNVYGVTAGAIVGHAVCTTMAVISGRLLANVLSIKTVTVLGGLLFVLFAILTII